MMINDNVFIVTDKNAVQITVIPTGKYWEIDPMTGALHLRLKKETVKRIAAALSEKKGKKNGKSKSKDSLQVPKR